MSEELEQIPDDQVEIVDQTDQLIGKALTKLKGTTATGAALAQLRETYANLTIAGVEDKDGYKAVSEGITILRSLRTSVEKRRKDLVAPAVKWQKDLNAEAKTITGIIQPLENSLIEKRDKIDAEKERLKRAAELLFMERTTALFKLGATFDGSRYVLKADIPDFTETDVMDPHFVQTATAEDWDKRADEFSALAGRIAAARVQRESEQKKKDQEIEVLRKRLAELEAANKPQDTGVPKMQGPPPPKTNRVDPFSTAPSVTITGPEKQPQELTGVTSEPTTPLPTTTYTAEQDHQTNPMYWYGFDAGIDVALTKLDDPSLKTRGEIKAAIQRCKTPRH